MHRIIVATLLVLAGLLSGCSGTDQSASTAGGKPGAGAVKGLDPASRLDLDSGRVSVLSPQGWQRASRSSDYLVRYESKPRVPYPAVVVIAADPPEGFAEVTGDNHAAFVEAVAGQLGDGKGVFRKPARAKVGPHHAVTWAAGGEAKLDGTTKKIERDCTAVVVAGRLYTVEAWAPRGKLSDTGRAAARAVAAGLAVPSLEPAESLEPLVPPTEPTPEPADQPKDPAAPDDGTDKPEMEKPGTSEPEAAKPAATEEPKADAADAPKPETPAAEPAPAAAE